MVSILNAVRDLGRLRQIYVVLVRHGFGEISRSAWLRRRQEAQGAARSRGRSERGRARPRRRGRSRVTSTQRGEEERTRISLAERVRLVAMDLGPRS